MTTQEYVIIFKRPTNVPNAIQMSVSPETMVATFTVRSDDGGIKEEKQEIEAIHINTQTIYKNADS